MTWADLALSVGALALMLMAPGYALARAFRVSVWPSLAVSPVLGLGLAAIVAHLFRPLGIAWSPVSWAAAATILTLIGAGTAVLRGEMHRPAWRNSAPGLALMAGTIVSAAIQGWALLRALVVPNAVPVGWDGIYHLSGIRAVIETGDASISAMSRLYQDATVSYPSGFHALGALVPWLGADAAANAVIILSLCLILPLGIAGLALAAFPEHPTVALLAPITGAWLITLPAVLFGYRTALPAALGAALVPAFLCLVWVAVYPRIRWSLLIPLGIATLGLAYAQPATVVGAGLMALPALVSAAIGPLASVARSKRWKTAFAIGVGAGLVASLIAAVLAHPRVQAVANYPRGTTGADDWERFTFVLTDESTLVGAGWEPWILPMLLIIGAMFALVQRSSRAVLGAWIVAATLTVGAMKVEWWGSVFTGFFYNDFPRILALVAGPMGVLSGAGVALIGLAIHRIVQRRLKAPALVSTAAGLLAVSLVVYWAWDATGQFRDEQKKAGLEYKYFTPNSGWMRTVVSSWDEIEFIRETSAALPDDAVIVGNPLSGTTFFYALGGVDAYPKAINTYRAGTAEHYLVRNFHDYLEDPAVCEAVRELGATHVYLKPVDYAEGINSDQGRPGFFDVPRDGLTPYAMYSDEVGLWTIDACD